jgi:hypothetical protein
VYVVLFDLRLENWRHVVYVIQGTILCVLFLCLVVGICRDIGPKVLPQSHHRSNGINNCSLPGCSSWTGVRKNNWFIFEANCSRGERRLVELRHSIQCDSRASRGGAGQMGCAPESAKGDGLVNYAMLCADQWLIFTLPNRPTTLKGIDSLRIAGKPSLIVFLFLPLRAIRGQFVLSAMRSLIPPTDPLHGFILVM